MSQRPHGKGVVSDSEGLATSDAERKQRSSKFHGEKHVHLTNNIHIRRHLHLQSHGTGGLMLDARRTTPQLPLLREVTALQKIRTLQDPGTSSGSATASSAGSSARRGHSKSVETFIGDPHRDAQALAIELSGKLAKSAEVSYASDGASSRVSRPQRGRVEKGIRVDNPPSKRGGKKMTAEERGNAKGYVEVPSKVDVRDRIKRIEQAFQDGSTTNTLSGELRKEGLIKELKERGRIQRDREIAERSKADTAILRSDERWEEGPARREELARRVIEERGSSISSLSQLLGAHYGSGRSAQQILLGMVDDEVDQRSSNHGESLFETDEDELSPMEREMTRPRPATLNPASPLHLASLSRGKEEFKRARNPRSRKTKPGSKGSRERNVNAPRPRSRNVNPGVIPPSSAIADDELDVSELPPQNGCGVQWDWSRIHKYGGKAFLDLTGLTCTAPESARRGDLEAMMAEQSLPVQSISSLDSDANALPLIIGEDAHDSDFAAGYIETGRSREVPQKLATKRKVSLQNAVKDVPVVEPASTSRSKEGLATPPPEGPRTLTQKYRPKNFRDIVGQSVVVKSLSTAIMKGKVAPVYLFMGPRGTGKTSAARVFAAGLNCESLDYVRRPCAICRECGTMALNRSADVREIDAASNADLASIRAAMGSFQPVGRYKVFIVEGCDSLSTDIWNAFLKVLEEPPTNVVFILITTDADQIPDTATSRCQKFNFSKVKEADIVTRLEILARKEDLDVEEGALALIAARSDGSLRDAEIRLDQVCLLDKVVSVELVRELVGLLPDTEILDLLDYALSADTMNTVRTLREVLACGVEPLSLVSQLGTLITDILAGSYDVHREIRGEGFFNRNFSVKEEQHRLRQALKILSESEKQLRVTSDRATWLTAALLQFAPDRSFLPSEANNSAAQSPLAPQSARPAPHHSLPRSDLPSMDEPEYQTQLGSSMELGQHTLEAYAESSQRHDSPEVKNAVSLSEQKLEEAWTREPQQVAVEYAGETSEARRASEAISLEFQVFRDEALDELWNRVLREITSRSLKHLLHTHGRLVAAGVAVDGSCAVVELEFDYPRDKHKAERSWRSICIAFQAVLSTAVELRIALSDMPPEEAEAARIGETMTDMQAGPSTPPKNTEIVTEDSNGDYSMRPGLSTLNPKQKEIAYDDDAYLREMQGVAPSRGHRKRGTKARKHRHATESLDKDPRPQQSPDGITPRRLPPSRRRKGKRSPKTAKTVIPVREMRLSSLEDSSFGGGEIWDSGPQLIMMDKQPGGEKKKLLSTMMEEPQSEIEDIRSARKRIWEQRSARLDVSQPAAIDRRTSTVDAQRGLPKESLRCWKRPSPQRVRKTRVKGLRKARGKALFLKMVPCSHSRITRNAPPAP
ncbi:hypothetical protein M758_1G136300 [Ceratodon purpureus]|nr:hypothetical protein M758_1G136300 [Ceratodon purpureus]